MTDRPETSVIIPVLNGEAFILDAVASVLGQLGSFDEVLVVDDASTDRTRNLLHRRDPRISVLDGAGRGPSAARNVALAHARGDFIAFLDHDDLWPEGRHRALMAALKADQEIDAAAGRIRIKIEHSGSPGEYPVLDGRHALSLPWTCLYRRRLIEKVGFFDESLRYGEDVDYYVRLTEAGMKLVMCEHDSLIYRRHSGNATNSAPPQKIVMMKVLVRKFARSRRYQGTAKGSLTAFNRPTNS